MKPTQRRDRRRGLRRMVALAAGAGLAATVLAACSSAGDVIEADEETGNRTIRIAMPFISTMNSAIFYGAGNGIFEKHNIEIEFLEVDGARGLSSTLSGSVDMAITSAVNPVAALEQDQEFYIVAQIGNSFPESVLVTTADFERFESAGGSIDSPWQDKMDFLRGEAWGVSSPEGSSVYMARYMFQLAGFAQDDFNMNSLGSSSATLAALNSEQVVAGSMGSPNPQIAEADGYAKVFISVAGGEVPELRNTLTSVVAVPPQFYEANTELVEDFREALAEAQQLVYDDPEAVDNWMYENHFDGSPKDAVLRGVSEQREGDTIAREPEVSEEAAENLVAFMRETGQDVPDDWRKIFIDLQ